MAFAGVPLLLVFLVVLLHQVSAQSCLGTFPATQTSPASFCTIGLASTQVLLQSTSPFQLTIGSSVIVAGQPFPQTPSSALDTPVMYAMTYTLSGTMQFNVSTVSGVNASIVIAELQSIAALVTSPFSRTPPGSFSIFYYSPTSPSIITAFPSQNTEQSFLWTSDSFSGLATASLVGSLATDLTGDGAPTVPILQTIVDPRTSPTVYVLVYSPPSVDVISVVAFPMAINNIAADPEGNDRLPLIPERTQISETLANVGYMAWNVTFTHPGVGWAFAQVFPKTIVPGQTLCQYMLLPSGQLVGAPQCLINRIRNPTTIPALFDPSNFTFTPSNLMQGTPTPTTVLVVLASYAGSYSTANPAIVASAAVNQLLPRNLTGFSVSDQTSDPLLNLYLLESNDPTTIWEFDLSTSQYSLMMNGWYLTGSEIDMTQYTVSYWPASNFLLSPSPGSWTLLLAIATQTVALSPGPVGYYVSAAPFTSYINATADSQLTPTSFTIAPLTTIMIHATVAPNSPLFMTVSFSAVNNMFIAWSFVSPEDAASYMTSNSQPRSNQYQFSKYDFNTTGTSDFYLLLESVSPYELLGTIQMTNYVLLDYYNVSSVSLDWNPAMNSLFPHTILMDFQLFNYYTEEIYAFNPDINIEITSRNLWNSNGTSILAKPETNGNFTLYSNYEFDSDGPYGIVTLLTGPCTYVATGLPCGYVANAITLSLKPFSVTPMVPNYLYSGILSANNSRFWTRWDPSAGMQLHITGGAGICYGWDIFQWHNHGRCNSNRYFHDVVVDTQTYIPRENLTYCPSDYTFVQTINTINAVYAMVYCQNPALGCDYKIAALARTATNPTLLPTVGTQPIAPQYAVYLPEGLPASIPGNVAVLYLNKSDPTSALGLFDMLVYDEEWEITTEQTFPKVSSLDTSETTLAAGLLQAIRVFSEGVETDSFGCAQSFGQLISMSNDNSFIVTSVAPNVVQVLVPNQEFDYVLTEENTLNLCPNTGTCQIRLLDAGSDAFFAMTQSVITPTNPSPIQIVGYSRNPVTRVYTPLTQVLALLNAQIAASPCITTGPNNPMWISLEVSDDYDGVFSYGSCVWYFNFSPTLPSGYRRSYVISPPCVDDTQFGRSASVSVDGLWVTISGSSAAYVMSVDDITWVDGTNVDISGDPLPNGFFETEEGKFYIDDGEIVCGYYQMVPTYDQWGYHNQATPPSISNLHSYILSHTRADDPTIIVMVTDTPSTMSFGDAFGVAPIQTSPPGQSWIPSLRDSVECAIGSSSNESNLNPCSVCPQHTYSRYPGAISCLACPTNAFCPAGSVLPMTRGMAADGQQFPFSVEPADGAEEILIGELIIQIQHPYLRTLLVFVCVLFVAFMFLLIPARCLNDGFLHFQERLRKWLRFFDREPEPEFEAETLELKWEKSVIAGGLKLVLYVVLILGVAFAIFFSVSYQTCTPPEFQSLSESLAFEQVYNLSYVTRPMEVAEEAEKLCLSPEEYNVVRTSVVTSPTGLPEPAQYLLDYLTVNQPGAITMALIGFRPTIEEGRTIDDICSGISLVTTGCFYTEGEDDDSSLDACGSVDSEDSSPPIACSYLEEDAILLVNYTMEAERKWDLSMSFQFTFPLDVKATSILGNIYFPGTNLTTPEDLATTGTGASAVPNSFGTMTSWQRFVPDTWGSHPLTSISFSAVYTPCVRQSELYNGTLFWRAFTRFSPQLPIPIAAVSNNPQLTLPLNVTFKLTTTGFVTMEVEARNLVSTVLIFTLVLAFIGLYHVIEVISEITQMGATIVEKIQHRMQHGSHHKKKSHSSAHNSLPYIHPQKVVNPLHTPRSPTQSSLLHHEHPAHPL